MKSLAWSGYCVLLFVWWLYMSTIAGSSISDSRDAKLTVIQLKRELVRLRQQVDHQHIEYIKLFRDLGVNQQVIQNLMLEFRGRGLKDENESLQEPR